ncbi:hypothetical protein QE152_g9320 [Popillia japonica]|uniref:Uncharacterized protein n=1 Tax=Popillia japonica TaxID=7064 RepID=A0AAW1LZD5_POPJA
MTDKFGRSIHRHVIKKHLRSHNVIKHIFKQPSAKEAILLHAKSITTSGIPVQSATTSGVPVVKTTIITLSTDGDLSSTGFYKLQNTGELYYTNKLHKGKITNLVRSKDFVQLVLNLTEIYDPEAKTKKGATQSYIVEDGTILSLKYVGQTPLPKTTEQAYIEILLEEEI